MKLTKEALAAYQKSYNENPAMKAASYAISKHPIDEVIFDQSAANSVSHLFNHLVPTMRATNQKGSGRCWLFAALNVMRERVAKEAGIEQFELSQNYMAFWDKLEKSNYVLESILETLDEAPYSRLLDYILQTGVQDGGQWDMFVSLVEKYGVVPQSAMPETFLSGNTRSVNRVINIKLRRTAAVMRKMHAEGASRADLEKVQAEVMDEIYSILCAAFGCPPTEFDWEYKNKEGAIVREAGLTPKAFFDKYVAFPFDEYASIINSPTADKPYNRAYTVRFLGNVVGGRPVSYLNTDIETMKAAVIKQINAGETVWFGSDCGWYGDREGGKWVVDMTDYGPLFGGMAFDTTKEERLDMRLSAMNHAMTITGYHEVDGKPVRYRIQNSWGEDRADKGYYVCDDKWFDDYVFQAVVRKEYLPAELLAAEGTEPIVLDPWDPMGTLAD
ncbi:MAG: C1 family peptidase [Clostridia bacterium]|nr:C1 family peptidase [Clostridia bacterium]